jgi:hypothetical protein
LKLDKQHEVKRAYQLRLKEKREEERKKEQEIQKEIEKEK